jgi:hypothetical protein
MNSKQQSKPKKNPPDPKAQNRLFRKLARELECDESEAAFDTALKKIGRTKTAKSPARAARKVRQ